VQRWLGPKEHDRGADEHRCNDGYPEKTATRIHRDVLVTRERKVYDPPLKMSVVVGVLYYTKLFTSVF